MPRFFHRLGTLCFVVVLATNSPEALQDDGEPMAPAAGAVPAEIVQANKAHDLGHGIEARALVSVSRIVLDLESQAPERVVSVALTNSTTRVVLEQSFAMRHVGVGSSEAVVLRTGEMNTGHAQLVAAVLTGDDVSDPASHLAAGDVVLAHRLAIAPVPGMTWGGVASADDIVLTASLVED